MLATCIAAFAALGVAATPPNREVPSLGLDLTGKAPEAGSLVVIPWGRLGGRGFDTAAHARLVTALEIQLPGRLIAADEVWKAFKTEGLASSELRTPDGIYRLAHAVWAYRALTVAPNGKDVVLVVYDTDKKVRVKRVVVTDASALNKADVTKVAQAAAKMAFLSIDLKEPQQPEPEPDALLQPLVPEGTKTDNGVSDADLEEAMRGAPPPMVRPKAPKPPFLRFAVGGGAGFGNLTARGPAAAGLAPVRSGTVPDIALYLAVEPLRLADAKIANAQWAGLLVESTLRRAFAHASSVAPDGSAVRCTMDDDEVMVRVGWRYRFRPEYAPQVGFGAGWGQDRLRFHCGLPVPSTSYRAFDVHLRVLQPLYRKLVWVELVAGPRFGLGGNGTRVPGPAVDGDIWVYGQMTPYLFVRGGVRFATTRLDQAVDLSVSTFRTSVALELGVSF